MLRTRATTRSTSQSRTLPRELRVVDRLLEDERFFAPFIAWSRTPMGRPSIPVEQYLRLMFLKRRYGLSYESVVRLVADNVAWRTFCRIPQDRPVPHYTTLVRWTQGYGEDTVQRINEELLRKLESV